MNRKIADNIKRLRKAGLLTQEQLAEALGVTVGAVYKWENGRSVPELGMLMRLSDLFQVSLDALVGYQAQSGGVVAVAERIHALQQDKKYDEAAAEAEKALLRYPNDFRIVYRAGELYAVAGIELKREKHLYRCIELMERSVQLLSQNTDPSICEASLQAQIAQCYLVLGKTQKGVEILKRYNVRGVNDPLIAIALAGDELMDGNVLGLGLEDAVPFMMGAFGSLLTNAIRTLLAYSNYYGRKKEYANACDALLLLTGLLEGIRMDQDAPCYVDKVNAPCYAACAKFFLLLGEEDKVESYLRRAYRSAVRFDSAPTIKLENVKFCIGDLQNATTYDDLGESAVVAVMDQLTREGGDHRLLRIWERIADEEALGGAT
ncbi:MAG: helix-turn-helix transcriptional regulator [Clostridia bacterium]|nr:helix-turn-helix transcriptional regulator [Clostridia bacterium]